jgi:hypothetical protein
MATPGRGDGGPVLDAFERSDRLADYWRHRTQEYAGLAAAFVRRVREGSLPPDDACVWARILVRQAEMIGLLPKGWKACE